MIFWKKKNNNNKFLVSFNSNFPALGVTSSQVVSDNLNAMHAARQAFIQSKFSEKIKHALTHQIKR